MAIGDIKAGRAYVEIGTDDAQLNKGLAAAQQKVTTFGNGVKDISTQMMLLGAAAVAAGYKVAQFLVRQLTAAVERASELVDTADKLGVSLESLQNLQFIGGRVGVEAETLNKALAMLQKNLGGGKISGELKSIGLNIEDLKKMKADEAFMVISDALRLVSDETERAALTAKFFGRGGQELNNVLRMGSESMRQMAREGKALGAVMNDEVARGLENAGDAMGDAGTAWNSFWNNSGIQDWLVAVADVASETMTWGEAVTQTVNGTQLALDRANADIRQAQKDRENAVKVEQAMATAKAEQDAALEEELSMMADEISLLDDLSSSMGNYVEKLKEAKKVEEERKKQREELMRRAERMRQENMTDQEQFDAGKAEARQLLAEGLITKETYLRQYGRLLSALPKRMQEAMSVTSSASGTFNARAVGALGGDDELTIAAKDTAKNTKRLVDLAGQGMVLH